MELVYGLTYLTIGNFIITAIMGLGFMSFSGIKI
jgi:Na+-transporting NADH:ubiquinone oxidoreductase subunit NqrE